jgi:hypothetical protein
MLTRAMPCPDCLCANCTLFTDDFTVDDLIEAYHVVTGVWTISDGELHPPVTALALITLQTEDDPTDGVGVRFAVHANFHDYPSTFDVLVDFVDANNYHFARLHATGETTAHLILFKREAGVATQLATADLEDFDLSAEFLLEVCWSYTDIRAAFDGHLIVFSDTVGLGGAKVGLLAVSPLTVNDLTLTRLKEGCPECGGSPRAPCTGLCINDDAPRYMLVTMPDGVLQSADGHNVGFTCVSCEDATSGHSRLVEFNPELSAGACCVWVPEFAPTSEGENLDGTFRTEPAPWEMVLCHEYGTGIDSEQYSRNIMFISAVTIAGGDAARKVYVTVCYGFVAWAVVGGVITNNHPFHNGYNPHDVYIFEVDFTEGAEQSDCLNIDVSTVGTRYLSVNIYDDHLLPDSGLTGSFTLPFCGVGGHARTLWGPRDPTLFNTFCDFTGIGPRVKAL